MKKNSLFVCLFVSGQRSEVKKTSKSDFSQKTFLWGFRAWGTRIWGPIECRPIQRGSCDPFAPVGSKKHQNLIFHGKRSYGVFEHGVLEYGVQ